MIEQTARDNILAIAQTYAAATGLSLATVSRQFHGNQAFLADFERGERSITLSKAEQMLAAFSASWPRGIKWPKTKPLLMRRMGKKVAP